MNSVIPLRIVHASNSSTFALICGLLHLCHASAVTLQAQPTRIEISRDTWVSAYQEGGYSEQDGNNGGDHRLKLKGIQEFSIVDIDPSPLRGRLVKSATLHVHLAGKKRLHRVTVSTLASDWAEGSATGYRKQVGSASFNWAMQDQAPWAYPASDITAASLGQGHTYWRFADAIGPDKRGFQRIKVDPRVIAARIAGISHGFVVFDDVGNEYTRDGEKFEYHVFPNRYVHSRQARQSRRPYFQVEFLGRDDETPGTVEGLTFVEPIDLPPGEAVVTWRTPVDQGNAGVIGFFCWYSPGAPLDWENARDVPRYLIPLAGGVGDLVTMRLHDLPNMRKGPITLGVCAVDAAGNVGPVTAVQGRLSVDSQPTLVMERNPSASVPLVPVPKLGDADVFVIDALDKVNGVTGELIPANHADYLRQNHVWTNSTRRVTLAAARNEFVAFQVVVRGPVEPVDVRLTFDGEQSKSIRADVQRLRYVQTNKGLFPDPVIPNASPMPTWPRKAKKTPTHLALLAEVYVPHDAPSGEHRGTLLLRRGADMLELGVSLRVWNFTLPDHLSFIPQMNGYGVPAPPEDLAYYRVAHEHRTCLNRLPYNWRGQVNPGCAPRNRKGRFDWAAYDARFGPLFDGTGFSDLPRRGVPIEVFYLPLNENWPVKIEPNFKGGYWIENAVTPRYRAQFVNACRMFAQHFRERGWNDTFFEFYLNNKVIFKRKGWSSASAPWLFDEPTNTQDFWALHWFGRAFHEGVGRAYDSTAPGDILPRLVYRCDISRPQWQRDTLDGVLDVNVVGGPFHRYLPLIMDRKHRNDNVLYNYGGSNNITVSNVWAAAWCIDTWCLGGDGVLPWQTIGGKKAWIKGDSHAMFYHGKPLKQVAPVPSIRLKAYRRGQQDVEYLVMFAKVYNHPCWRVGRDVRRMLQLKPVFKAQGGEDAGTLTFGALSPRQLWDVRMKVGALLDRAAPPAKRRWIDLRTSRRTFAGAETIGHVATQ